MSSAPVGFLVRPGCRVGGEIWVPGDKSISHRAAMLGAIADGVTEIEGFLAGEDCLATLRALQAMGVRVQGPDAGRVVVHGAGMQGLRAPSGPIDLGNSGTAMRLFAGMLCGQPFDSTLVGDPSLMRRPMERVAAPLRRMGALVRTDHGRPPITITGGQRLRGCEHELELPSAQVKSAILLAGLYAEGRTSVCEPGISRDHTEKMLEIFGVTVTRDPRCVAVSGTRKLTATKVFVPGDFSSAAFFIVAGLIAGRAPLTIREVGVNPTRTGLLDMLRSMGADIHLRPVGNRGGEPSADIEVRPSALRGVQVPPALVPVLMDELPVLLAAAAVAEGDTVISGASELRVKETDRIAAMAEGLGNLGIATDPKPDGLRVRGGDVRGGRVESRGDHRIAMAFAVLGARAASQVEIREVQNVATSFPGFAGTARAVGLDVEEAA